MPSKRVAPYETEINLNALQLVRDLSRKLLRGYVFAIDYGFRGVGTTNSNSCASGTVSVGEALRYIRDNFVDVVVAGGAEAPLTAITVGASTTWLPSLVRAPLPSS